MAIKHHNYDYLAGPTFPTAIGDRLYAQDLFRDFHYHNDDSGRKTSYGFDGFPVLLKDSNVTKGTLWTDLDIPIAKGIVEYEVNVPSSYAALPPTVTQEDIYVRIETTAETDFDISGTATLDGVTVNYVKVTYIDLSGATRTRAKKAGSYVFQKLPSYTITVDAVAPTNKDLVLAEVVGDGAASLIITCYPRTRHYGAAYDYVVASQEDFNIIIDYTAANQYRIKDNIKSIYVKYLAGGYQMTGATSPLQEGDTYGYIETNDCSRIVFEQGTYIDMHQNIGYLEIDTGYCYLENVSIRGDKGASSAIQRSFLLNQTFVTLMNCNSRTRLSNTTFTAFEGSAGTAIYNQTANVIGCEVFDCDSSGAMYGYRYFYNLSDCLVRDVESTAGTMKGFYACTNLSNCTLLQLDGSTAVMGLDGCYECNGLYMIDFDSATFVYGLYQCYNCSNIHMEDFDAPAVTGIYQGTKISNAYVYDLNATGGICRGSEGVNEISNCYMNQLDATSACSGFYDCDRLNNCHANNIDSSGIAVASGYYQCNHLTSCYSEDIDCGATAVGFLECLFISGCESRTADYGFRDSNNISSSYALLNATDGFEDCDRLSACTSYNNTGNGYTNCDYISSSSGNNNGVDGYNNCDFTIGCIASTNTGDGFQDCNSMGHNRSAGNGTNYNNSFADFAGSVAPGDNSAGGWNA